MPTGDDVPRTVSVLVFLRDRGIFLLWGLLIAVFAFWCSPYFFTIDNALLIANAAAMTAMFAAGVGIGIMTGVLDLSLPGHGGAGQLRLRLAADQRLRDLARPGGRPRAAASWSASSTA